MAQDLYFNTTDFNNETDFKRGDVVRMYKEASKLEFPCIILSCEKLEMFRVEAIRGLLSAKTLTTEEGNNYKVYINLNGDLVQVGEMPDTRLRFVLSSKVFAVFEKRVHTDENTTVTGEMLYALCVI